MNYLIEKLYEEETAGIILKGSHQIYIFKFSLSSV